MVVTPDTVETSKYLFFLGPVTIELKMFGLRENSKVRNDEGRASGSGNAPKVGGCLPTVFHGVELIELGF